MSLIVQKFGGTSVATPEKITEAARKAIRAQAQGHQVVMVVSAMGKNTDVLVDLANAVSSAPSAREMDMLLSTGEQVSVALVAMAIHELGGKATSLTGGQIGIKTDSSHTKARIQNISTERMKSLLDDGHVVIAAGFQGTDDEGNITTLGRGGSDTTAVALAAVLGADECHIYTDVDGVFTTDPRLVAEARKMDRVSHNEMLELASLGAGVMHSRSIEFGKKFNVPIHVRNSGSFNDDPGTVIGPDSESADRPVSGCALTKNEARVSMRGVPDQPGTMNRIFSELGQAQIAVDMIVQDVGADGKADIAFTVIEGDFPAALKAVKKVAAEFGDVDVQVEEGLSKVSVVGLGMATQTGVADRMFRVLADRPRGKRAWGAVHRGFDLDKPPARRRPPGSEASQLEQASPADIVARLQRMEDLTIENVSLDQSQGRVTLTAIPDKPGIAAQIFEAVASENLLVDMIVQGAGSDGLADLSFTVPRDSVAQAVKVVEETAADLDCGPVESDPAIAILSVFGIGIRTHVGVGVRMFAALADAGINVEMINTSEMRVNVVVDSAQGDAGLEALKAAFADVMG